MPRRVQAADGRGGWRGLLGSSVTVGKQKGQHFNHKIYPVNACRQGPLTTVKKRPVSKMNLCRARCSYQISSGFEPLHC
ncbi:hypothetical protein EMIT0215P_10369 [Pseudomonas serboccidentalis]